MRIIGNMGTKWCPKCRDFKPPEDFGKDERRPDGKHPYCRMCRKPIKQRDMQKYGATYYAGTDYVSRMSVPPEERIRFDELLSQGECAIVVDASGQEHRWEDLD